MVGLINHLEKIAYRGFSQIRSHIQIFILPSCIIQLDVQNGQHNSYVGQFESWGQEWYPILLSVGFLWVEICTKRECFFLVGEGIFLVGDVVSGRGH